MSQSAETAGHSGQTIVHKQMAVDNLKYLVDFTEEKGEAYKAFENLKNKLNEDEKMQSFEERFTFPEDSDFYLFAEASYDYDTPASDSSVTNEALEKKGWVLLYTFEGSTGAIAKLYFSPGKHQLVLAFKGTSLSLQSLLNRRLFLDLYADLKGVTLKYESTYFSSACTIADKVRNVIEDLKGRAQLFITGHSLGGYLAQIATYSIKNQRIRDNKFVSTHSEDLEIHARTIVFDSPPCLDRVLEYTESKPYLTKHMQLDITTLIHSKNIINGLRKRRHLGTVLWLEPKDKAEESTGILDWIKLTKGHSLINFSEYGWKDSSLTLHNVESVHDWRVRRHDPRVLPLATFSEQELECLKLIPFLEFVERKDYNLQFKISNVDITIFNEHARTFVPKVKYLVRDKGLFEKLHWKVRENYQQSIEKMVKLFHDEPDTLTMDLRLQKSYKDRVENHEGDGYIVLPNSTFREKIILAQIMQNSIGNFLFMSYEKFKKLDDRDFFVRHFWGTLAILVEDGPFEHHSVDKNCTMIIITNSEPINFPRIEKIENLSLKHITPGGRRIAVDFEVDFYGNPVTFKSLCGDQLPANKVELTELIDFSVQFEEKIKSTFLTDFYIKQDLSILMEDTLDSSRWRMEDLVSELKCLIYSGNQVKMLLSAGPGLGKSTYLRVLREELQKEMKDFWIIKINMLDCSEFLSGALNKKNTPAAENQGSSTKKYGALELIKEHAIPKNSSKLVKSVLKKMLTSRKVFLLLDAFDEVCPEYRTISEALMISLTDQKYSFLLSSRPHEIKNLQEKRTFRVKTYQLREMDEGSQKEFFTKFLTHRIKDSTEAEICEKTRQLLKSLRDTKVPANFWGIPLQALLVARLFEENNYNIEDFNNLASLFSKFLDIRLSRDLIEKLEMSASNAKAKQKFEKAKQELENCLQIAAARRILGSQVAEALSTAVLNNLQDDINGTGIATVQSLKTLTVEFSHQSFAEYLAAKYLVEYPNHTKVVEILKEILSSPFYQSTRRFYNDIVGQSENEIVILSSEHEEQLDQLQELQGAILKALVSENLFELYEVFKNRINFKLQDPRTGNESPSPQKKLRWEPTRELPEHHPIMLALRNADERFVQKLIQDSEINLKTVSSEFHLTLLELTAQRNFINLTMHIMQNRPDECPVERYPGMLIRMINAFAVQSSQDYEELKDCLLENGCEIADSPMD